MNCFAVASGSLSANLTWTKKHGLQLFDDWMAAYTVSAPAEENLLGQRRTGVEGTELPRLQRDIPNIQVGDISNKGLREIPSKGILVLTQDEYPVPVDIPWSVQPRPHVFPLPIHIDSPVAIAPAPGNTQVMPCSVIGKGGLIWLVFPVDDECQENTPLHVHLATELEFISEHGCSIGEDGGHLVPLRVPLNANTHTHGRHGREGHVDTSKALTGFSWEVQS